MKIRRILASSFLRRRITSILGISTILLFLCIGIISAGYSKILLFIPSGTLDKYYSPIELIEAKPFFVRFTYKNHEYTYSGCYLLE